MSILPILRRLLDYNQYMNRRLWERCILPLTEEQYQAHSDYSSGSVHRQMVHTMAVEELWLARAQGTNPEALPKAREFAGRAAVRARWDALEARWREYLNTLNEEDLACEVEYRYITQSGTEPRRMQRWEMVVQVTNHGTDHRAQTLALIHQLGGATMEQDYTLFTWEHPAEPPAWA